MLHEYLQRVGPRDKLSKLGLSYNPHEKTITKGIQTVALIDGNRIHLERDDNSLIKDISEVIENYNATVPNCDKVVFEKKYVPAITHI